MHIHDILIQEVHPLRSYCMYCIYFFPFLYLTYNISDIVIDATNFFLKKFYTVTTIIIIIVYYCYYCYLLSLVLLYFKQEIIYLSRLRKPQLCYILISRSKCQ